MISSTELRKGVTIELDGTLYSVLDYQHIKMGRGSAQVRVKLRDVRGGHTIEKSFQAGEKFSRARLDRHPMQFLYEDGGLYYFMNTETYEQTPLNKEQVGDALLYLKENETCDLLTYGEDPLEIELPTTVDLKVTNTDPGFKGDTTSGATKAATLETGLTVQVPLFIDEGNVLKVDTRTGEYIERVNA